MYEIVRLSGASRADALFRIKGSDRGGLCIQLKSATSMWQEGRCYVFQRVLGYGGMLVIFMALDGGHIWAASGRQLSTNSVTMTIGCASDARWRVSDIGSVLVRCFHDVQQFPHLSILEARLQCSPTHRVEASAHQQLHQLFGCVGTCLTCPAEHQTTVDSLLKVEQGHSVVRLLRLQETASHKSKSGRYEIRLSKNGGALDRLHYAPDDFDTLVACVLHEQRVQGAFLIPSSVLADLGCLGIRACSLSLYPPWSPPKQRGAKQKYAWQSDFFLDLRTWRDTEELPGQLQKRLTNLVSGALARQKNCA